MPKYKYKCNGCGGTFMLVQKINEAPETRCYLTIDGELDTENSMRCSGDVRRVPSTGGFVLNGKGWFRAGS